jgi:hypothetical protein
MMNATGWQERYAAFSFCGVITAAGDTFSPGDRLDVMAAESARLPCRPAGQPG